jgi:p-cumate 2,3-dioxygenase beta subunit
MDQITSSNAVSRTEVEDFLYHEADLIDGWDLLTWLSLFEQECLYQIVTPGIPNADTANADDTLLLVSDNIERLDQRIRRILKKTAHVEFPHSQTSHMLTNIRVTQNAAGEIDVRNRFLTFRTKSDRTVQFFGHQIYKLTHRDGQLRIKIKRTMLDFDTLADQGKVTIIL